LRLKLQTFGIHVNFWSTLWDINLWNICIGQELIIFDIFCQLFSFNFSKKIFCFSQCPTPSQISVASSAAALTNLLQLDNNKILQEEIRRKRVNTSASEQVIYF